MADWDWGSSDIGSGSSGGFSGDDYYWTGGKFSDWNGKSAGKFDGGSSGSSSDSPGGGFHSSDKKNDREPEKSQEQPVVVGGLGLIWKILMLCFLLLLQGMNALMYIHYPDCKAYIGHGTGFLCSLSYLLWFIVENYNLIYNFRRISAWKMHLFRTFWLMLCSVSLFICSVIALTPVWCHYLRYWLVQHHELFIFTFFDPELTHLYSTDFNLEPYWWIMVISAFIAWFPFLFSLGMLYFIPNEIKKTQKMIPYIRHLQKSQKRDKILISSSKSSETKVLFTSLLLIGMLFTAVMVLGSYQNYNRDKRFYDTRMEYIRQLDEMLHRNDQLEEDSVEIAKRDSTRRVNDSICVVRQKESEKKKAEERSAYEKEIRREADKFLRSYSGKSRGTYSSDFHSSDHHSNNDDDDDDDDDTWYRDEDDADEQYEYDYWE